MKLHRNIALGIELGLKNILVEKKPAADVIKRLLKSNTKWGSRDRKAIGKIFYDIIRQKRLIEESLGFKKNETNNNGNDNRHPLRRNVPNRNPIFKPKFNIEKEMTNITLIKPMNNEKNYQDANMTTINDIINQIETDEKKIEFGPVTFTLTIVKENNHDTHALTVLLDDNQLYLKRNKLFFFFQENLY